jgi:hypothetical protein
VLLPENCSLLRLLMRQLHWQIERHRLRLSVDDLMVGVDQLNPYLVLADRQPGDVDRVVVARVRPPPGLIVDGDVHMSNSWGYFGSRNVSVREFAVVLRVGRT